MLCLLALLTVTGTSPERTVVIGDSQAEGLKNARVLPRLGVDVYAFGGRTSDFFVEWFAAHPNVVAQKELVVFQLGGNDISRGESAQHIQDNMLALARLSRIFNPQAEVVFGAIPVRGQWFDAQKRKRKPQIAEREATLERVNAWIATGDHSDFDSFRVNAIIADTESPRLQRLEFKRRGADVHLNQRGYAALSRAIIGTLIAQ
jgi:lysophospholipase L1-like esterase